MDRLDKRRTKLQSGYPGSVQVRAHRSRCGEVQLETFVTAECNIQASHTKMMLMMKKTHLVGLGNLEG